MQISGPCRPSIGTGKAQEMQGNKQGTSYTHKKSNQEGKEEEGPRRLTAVNRAAPTPKVGRKGALKNP